MMSAFCQASQLPTHNWRDLVCDLPHLAPCVTW
jgi:hypothetical protein